jgi:hypothetical protein
MPVGKRIDQGRHPELVGGGLIRSLGGWSAVKALRRTGNRELSDERILGSGGFDETVPIEEIKGGSRRRKASRVRARIAIVSLAEAARQLGVSTSAISKILKTGELISQFRQQRPLFPFYLPLSDQS